MTEIKKAKKKQKIKVHHHEKEAADRKLRSMFLKNNKIVTKEILYSIPKTFTIYKVSDKFLSMLIDRCEWGKEKVKEGFTIKDLKYSIFKNIDPEHHYCKICGKEIHAEKNEYKTLCCAKCVNVYSVNTSYISILLKNGVSNEIIKKDFYTKEDVILMIKKYPNIKKCVLNNIIKRSECNKLLDDGFSLTDIKYCFYYDLDLIHKFCPICGKEIHVHRFVGYNSTCSKDCGAIQKKLTSVEKQLSIIDKEELSVDEVKYVLRNVSSSRYWRDFLERLFNRCKETSCYLKEGFTCSDIVYCLLNDIDLVHRYCSICGKEIHSEERSGGGYPELCSIECRQFSSILNIDGIIPMFEREDWTGYQSENLFTFKCKYCNELIHVPAKELKGMLQFKCNKCFHGVSRSQLDIYLFVKNLVSENDIILNTRSIISPYELDIFIKSRNIAIEYNGGFWHSSGRGKRDKFYHLNKVKMCNQKGIELIHIFDIDFDNNQTFYKNLIKSLLNNSKVDSNDFKFYDNKYVLCDGSEVVFSETEDKNVYDMSVFSNNKNLNINNIVIDFKSRNKSCKIVYKRNLCFPLNFLLGESFTLCNKIEPQPMHVNSKNKYIEDKTDPSYRFTVYNCGFLIYEA